ncbi:DEAD/DEAH box helicase [Gordonia aichiensis]|uniref:DEAD/DEAH box helicase n=1 Tax=Gordonia aichiensis TaxID=36820 RepID=UPI0032651AA1
MTSSSTFPSLLADETRSSIVEYLSTTFALADPNAQCVLRDFLADPSSGIFRGPYLKIRTPYQPVGTGWVSPLDWIPKGFRPFQHQAEAFERLSTARSAAQPTVVTTGTGSGKTESFLIPLLDHARRASARGETGVKAIILYPMNALVTDQARRLAEYLHDDPRLADVTAGVYIGGHGKRRRSTPHALTDHRETLRENPPDILLTNYRMLDLLLLRTADTPLWVGAATSLQYLVLDEFHTYDGAQGTDVAMLIRRLGAKIGVAGDGRPMGRVTPVATSATLGGGSGTDELRRFAETVFGTPFGPDSIVGETSLTATAVVPEVDFALEIPTVEEILAAPLPESDDPQSWVPLARTVLGTGGATGLDFTDPVTIGEGLRKHFLTRVAIEALGGEPRTIGDAVIAIAQAGVLPWGVHNTTAPEEVRAALLRFLALLSVARVRDDRGAVRPLVNVQVQTWVREITRMMRTLTDRPEFGWWHDGPADTGRRLPAVYCRVCGRAGWMAATTELGDSLSDEALTVWRNIARGTQRAKTRALLAARDDETDIRHLDTETLEILTAPGEHSLPVHMSDSDEDAVRQVCPSCGARNAVRFMGSSVATLLSVGLTTVFGSGVLAPDEKKTLVFTDSVQDAAHRAAFIEGRAFAFNFRSALFAAAEDGPTTLADAAQRLADSTSTADLYAITPPDFVRRLATDADWLDHDSDGRLRDLLTTRLAFQSHLELGLSSRTGRTLELTSALAADIVVDLDLFAVHSREIHQNLPQLSVLSPPETARYRPWLLGLLEHLRTNGGILHPWLHTYLAEEGNRWSIWGGSADGMPKFPNTRPAPSFYTTGQAGNSDLQSLQPKGESWLTDWTRRCLDVTAAEARALLLAVIDDLAGAAGPLRRRSGNRGARLYGLDPRRIVLHTEDVARMECPVCHHVQPTTAERARTWDGARCPRMRCVGTLTPSDVEDVNFYRTMYRSGRIRRIVSAEHTGLLSRDEREQVEARFKVGGSATDPNILACTPTLELGIDIGDLSTVALASLPRSTANYLQRVGRAGRSTGNAFILAAVPTSPRDLYYFARPEHLLAGEVLPPGAYLDATELLQRQYFAYCLDRLSTGAITVAQPMPPRLTECLEGGLSDGRWLRSVVDACSTAADSLVTEFLALFGEHVSVDSADRLRDFAAHGMRERIGQTAAQWAEESDVLRTRRNQLAKTIEELDKHGHLDENEREDRKRCAGEYKALGDQLYERGRIETLTGLSGVGLLPNYNLLDDATTLDVHLWWTADTGTGNKPQTEALDLTYERGSANALTELAPGAAFYAGGKRVIVDAVDVGPPSRPHWRPTRLCPDCGWGAADSGPITACPRCGSGSAADSGAVHRVLELRKVSAVHRLDDVLIDEDADDRTRTFFGTVTGVDIEPQAIDRAWRLKDHAFGAEYARTATVRTVNTGLGDQPGEELVVAGETRTAPGFTTCAHCGVVASSSALTADVRHRGYCATRRGTDEQWVKLLLSHELRTQAVRLLLPVSLLHFESTSTSFKGALLLGLRKDFGGDPQHLSVVASSMTDSGGGVRRFLVLHDTVPGGTGYLDRFGDPDRLRHILTLARDTLAACPCRTEERAACHRCLYGALPPREMEHASREAALRLLDQFLSDWEVEPVGTVAAIDIGSVQLSELEVRFRDAFKSHLAGMDGASFEVSLGAKGEELDIRLPGPGGELRRWRMRPLVQLVENGVATEPDFLLTRVDAQTADVAIYLDGKQFHASVQHNRTADDAVKRDALRRGDKRVWSITWEDVAAFEKASAKAVVADMVHQHLKNTASETVADKRLRSMWGNPIDFLLDYVADPDAAVWGEGAQALVLGMVDPAPKHGTAAFTMTSPAELGDTLVALASGQTVTSDPAGSVVVVPRHGLSGIPLFICADPTDFEATLGVLTVLDDSASEVGGGDHDERWRGWLRWSNVLQFVASPHYGSLLPRRMSAVWTVRSLPDFAAAPIPLASGRQERTDFDFRASPEWDLVRKYTDPTLDGVVKALAERKIGVPEPGMEVGPDDSVWQVELAWESEHVAVVIDEDDERDDWLGRNGWRVAHVDTESDPQVVAGEIETEMSGGRNGD